MLQGIRVVEIAGIGPGPFCAMHLADLGADVITVERPGTPDSGSEPYILNRGKRSVVADLKSAEGRSLVTGLVDGADALIEGMRPGVMERLGLGPAECRKRNPRIVYGRMTGWGQTGPLAQAAGHDNNYIALSGALYYSGPSHEPPSSAFTVLGDVGGGALYLTIGILAGILRARETGEGTVVDSAVVDGSAHMLQLLLSTRRKKYIGPERGVNIHDSSHFYATYRCSDDGYITVGAIEPAFYAQLLDNLGLRDVKPFPSQWDRHRWPEMQRYFTTLFASKTREEWCALLENTDVCFAPVLSPEEAALHPHNVARGVYFKGDGTLQAAPAPRFDGEAMTVGTVPVRGAHTEQIERALCEGDMKRIWK